VLLACHAEANMLSKSVALAAVLTIGVGLIGADQASAQTYPSHPITMGMPFAAGGPGDVLARILAERMRISLGQPVIVENITGAAGSIGAGRVARATPDGYSLILGNWTTHVVNPVVYSLPYDPVNDFEPIALVLSQPVLVVARQSMPAGNLKELIAWLKANPDKASAGNAGAGSATHVASIFFQRETGTRFQLVPYRGGAPAMQDLLAGQIDLMFDLTANTLPQMRAGNIKPYAVMAKSRVDAMPEIPTVDEAGVPGIYVAVWNGLWAPKGTPRSIIDRLNAAVVETLADPVVRQRLTDLGQEIPPPDQQTPQALAAYHKAEIAKWWPILKAAGIRGE
jgi:tripartite-type tricarboxylate transporter receptor subunit TctC